MARKEFIIFAVLIVLDYDACAQDRGIGSSCIVEITGNPGTCKISRNCPEVERQAQSGIPPTLCGTLHLTTPIVCCENSFLPQANEDSFLHSSSNSDSNSDYERNQGSNIDQEFNSNSDRNQGFNSNNNNRKPGFNSNSNRNPAFVSNSDRNPSFNSNSDRNPGFNSNSNRNPGFSSNGNRNPGFNSNSNSNRNPGLSSNGNRNPGFNSNSNSNRNPGFTSNSGNDFNSNSRPIWSNEFDNKPSSNSNSGNSDSFVYPEEPESGPSFPSGGSRISEQKCNEYNKPVTSVIQAIPLVTNTQPISIKVEKCEYNPVALIVGGKPAVPGEFPYMAAIGFDVSNNIEWRCGGTLISERYVLTAAHCTFSRDAGGPKVVRLGDIDLTRSDDGSVHADYVIDSLKVHPEYRYPMKYNDIALLRTSRQIKFNKFIRPACLYSHSNINAQKAIATGWGKTDFTASETSSKLMKVSLSILDSSICQATYKQPNKSLPRGIISTMLCAGHLKGGRDTCQGDSGGPLVITHPDNNCKFYVIGVTSFGKHCGAENIPAVYTKVSEYVPWIEQTVW